MTHMGIPWWHTPSHLDHSELNGLITVTDLKHWKILFWQRTSLFRKHQSKLVGAPSDRNMFSQNWKEGHLMQRRGRNTRSRWTCLSGACPVINTWSSCVEGVSIKQHTQQRHNNQNANMNGSHGVGIREYFSITSVWGETWKKFREFQLIMFH